MTSKAKRFSMLRSFVLADVITLGNAACGTGAILACVRYVERGERLFLWLALGLLPLALICDVLDGSIARRRRKHSALGADLDSLADIVSFGVAPAVLGYALGLRGFFDTVILIYFVACGISRLARYNATHDALADESGKVAYYEGTPIPTSLLVALVLGIAFATGHVGDNLWLGTWSIWGLDLHPLALLFAVSGSAMVSATLRIPKP